MLVEEGVPPLGVEAAELRRERRRRAPGPGDLELAGVLGLALPLPLPLLGLLHRRHLPPSPSSPFLSPTAVCARLLPASFYRAPAPGLPGKVNQRFFP